ncbi:LysE family transporter [Arthrobacter sp. HLT1-20]
MDITYAFAGGLLAGFGLAAPLGAIGVLLIREGVTKGFREAAPAAAAVGLVDAAYCAVAVAVGQTAAPMVASWGSLPRLVGGLALIALAGWGLLKTCAAGSMQQGQDEPPMAARGRRFLVFAGLTAANPATLIYFAALTAGLGAALGPPSTALAFVLGVAAASLGWQLGLALAGHALRGRVTARGQRYLNVVGHSIVLLLGAATVVASAAT